MEEQRLAIAAFTVSGWKGLVIRKVGSGRSPVSRRSEGVVIKITGTLKRARISSWPTARRPRRGERHPGALQRARDLYHRLPERLLTGERPEPPSDHQALPAGDGEGGDRQALFFHPRKASKQAA